MAARRPATCCYPRSRRQTNKRELGSRRFPGQPEPAWVQMAPSGVATSASAPATGARGPVRRNETEEAIKRSTSLNELDLLLARDERTSRRALSNVPRPDWIVTI